MHRDCKYYDPELDCCKKLSDWSDAMPVLEYCVDSPCEHYTKDYTDESKKLVNLLDGADLFLRNRIQDTKSPLNNYDIEAMTDIADVCDKSARLIEELLKQKRLM